MADEPRNRDAHPDGPPSERDEFDCVLDIVLGKFATTEPRTGLEERVLANLRAESERAPSRVWWRWGLAAAGAAVMVAVGLNVMWHKPAPSVTSKRPSFTTEAPERPGTQASSQAPSKKGPSGVHARGSRHVPRTAAQRSRSELAAEAQPKLDRFPSPQPLSRQELALANYVNQFPEEATLIARVQEEYEKEIQQQMKDARTETEFSDPDPQER